MEAMVNYRLIHGRGDSGVDSIYMLHELSPATGERFRDLGEAQKVGRKWEFSPKPNVNLERCSSPRLMPSRAGKGLTTLVEEQIAQRRAGIRS